MKHSITIFSIVGVLCCSIGSFAQQVADLPMNSAPFNFAGPNVMAYDGRYEGIKGSNTLFDEFRPGTIELKKGKFTDISINYDAYSDNLLAKNDKINDIVQMRKDMVQKFVIKDASGREFVFTKMNLNSTPTFLLNLVSDSISLFCRVSKKIKKAEIGGTYKIDQNNSDEFVTLNTYYVSSGNNELRELQKNKKGILAAFPQFETQLSSYLKKNKIDFNDYEQMKQLMTHINSL